MEESKECVSGAIKKKEYAPTCLVVTHLPKDANKREIEGFFGEVGLIRKCFLVRDKDWEFRGMAYIAYAKWQDAARARETLQGKPFKGNSLRIKFSRTRKKDLLKKKKAQNQPLDKVRSEHFDEDIKEKAPRRKVKDRSKFDMNKESRKMRERRIVVRNLSFKVTEQILEEHFSPFGKITELKLPRKDDGKLVGIAFLQYETKLQALKVIKECNMKPLLGRHIAVDIAVPKKKYESQRIKLDDVLDIKEEIEDSVQRPHEPLVMEVKKEDMNSDENDSGLEEEGDEEEVEDEEEEASDGEESEEDEGSGDVESNEDEGSGDDESNEDEESVDEEEGEKKAKQKPKSNRTLTNDVSDGRTLFVKNLSFDAEDDDVYDFFSRFGKLQYVRICMDPLTEHPRGTAFVQFKEKSSADKCLAAEADPASKEQFNFLDRQMHVMRALGKGDVELVKKNKEIDKVKDKRNLYLAREGVVRQGTRAAVGVSEADMRLRDMRERVKRRMLKNLNIFVSRTRLCINNLPDKFNEYQLKGIFMKHGDPETTIRESRIMKNFQDLDDNGKPKSRGYGFVTFTEHEHALAALRKINNNPYVFSEAKRPIIEFSLENREVLNAREKRLAKSREKNPTWNKGKNTKEKQGKNDEQKNSNIRANENSNQATPGFMGSKGNATAGVGKAFSSHVGPKIRHNARISRKQLKKQKQDRGKGVKRLRVMNNYEAPVAKKAKTEDAPKEKKKRPKKTLTKNFRAELKKDKNFKEMVERYKKKMTSGSEPTKKWYED